MVVILSFCFLSTITIYTKLNALDAFIICSENDMTIFKYITGFAVFETTDEEIKKP